MKSPIAYLPFMGAALVVALSLPISGGEVARILPTPDCPMPQNRMSIGPYSYQGQGGNLFQYESDAGGKGPIWHYQVAVKNVGGSPLTIKWEKPGRYYRHGIKPGAIAPGTCIRDGNPPNQDVDIIYYGPFTQLTGPPATFLWPAPSGTGPPPASTNLVITFDSYLSTGKVISIRLTLQSAAKIGKASYVFKNSGTNVWVNWKSAMGPMFFDAARKNPEISSFLKPDYGLLVKSGEQKGLEVSSEKSYHRVTQTVEIREAYDGILLYRDIAPAYTFDVIPGLLK